MIRPARLADQARIEVIVEAAYSPYLARMNRKPAPMVDDYAARIAAGQAHVLEQDGAIVGILVLEPGDSFLLLDNIAVDPGHHGTGLGRRLMDFAEEEARRRGYAAIERSEEHTSELQSLMRTSYADFRLNKKKKQYTATQ